MFFCVCKAFAKIGFAFRIEGGFRGTSVIKQDGPSLGDLERDELISNGLAWFLNSIDQA